jgi:hypothetical protein
MQYYYIFKGQNATSGKAHNQTGLLSMYGDLIAFTSKIKKKTFIEEYRSNNPSEKIWSCTENTCRRFFLGSTMNEMYELINYSNFCADDMYVEHCNN